MVKNNKNKYVQHFSVRIPWKDNDYTGKIDDVPKSNVVAQVLTRIAESQNLKFEEENKGKSYLDVGEANVKAWISENAAFMTKNELNIISKHPYTYREEFKHLKETTLKLEPFSFLLTPFSWLLKNNANEKQKFYNFNFDLKKTEELNEYSGWISHGKSQKSILEYFFSGIKANKSLIFPYYKQVPFIEDNRRIIAGIGNIISNVDELQEYESDGGLGEKNYLWEVNVKHSIRDTGKNGFLMPYLEIMDYIKKNPDFDVSTVTLFEPAGFRAEFSYKTEWVSYDAAIDVLNQAKKVLNNIARLKLKVANQKWVDKQLEYVDKQLENVWNQRGIYPGLGTTLVAFGIEKGFDISHCIDTSKNDLISELKSYFSGEKEINIKGLEDTLLEKEDDFFGLQKNENKLKLFELLARVNLSIEQATKIWDKFKDKAEEIVNNPYLLFELTQEENTKSQITISQVDNAMFVNELVDNKHPLMKPMKMRTESDKRRFRAMLIFVLQQAVDRGHTLLTYEQIIERIAELPLNRKTDFQSEKIEGILEFLEEGGLFVDDVHKYIKLGKYQTYKKYINELINKRLKSSNLPNKEDWEDIINRQFGELQADNIENDKKARQEKVEALKRLESSKISVFLGKAGTGKTSTLGIFASSEKIKKSGILALTPTGKSRVQLENSLKKNNNSENIEFMTIAQFLMRSGGFDPRTMLYKIPGKPSTSYAKTVIIDECSMLTEEMFAIILKLIDSHAERIIFTGDPNQLPPIGAGRPFVDLISYLETSYKEKIAKLETEMRQGKGGDDLSFAQIFSNSDKYDKDIIYNINNEQTDGRLRYFNYDSLENLEKIFYREIVSVAKMENEDDIDGFNKSLGATIGKYTNYLTAKDVEKWQILSPTKFMGVGSYYLNNLIHLKYRQEIIDSWLKNNKKYRNPAMPQSAQSIVYGDKVISNKNENRDYYDRISKEKDKEEYIANGEIGIMTDYPKHYGKDDKNKEYYKFMFSSFGDKVFSYITADFGSDDKESSLELAYALTVHKSQGSSFGKSIIVINGKNSYLSKELLYTAFSRQREELIILTDIPVQELIKYSNDYYSNTKQRYTDLFTAPNIIEIEVNKQKRYYEEKLIHKTIRGEMVRSKSEVIVANILDKMGIEYFYEKELKIKGEKYYIPDFTLCYQGKEAYLEHLGMMSNENYKNHWEKKKKAYESIGVTEKNKNLIITEEGPNGNIDSELIEEKIKSWINNI